MLSAVWLMLSTLLYSLQLSTGSFPKPLTEEEERYYLALSAQGDLTARNILIERNLRLVAHIMKKYYAQTADQEDLISIGTIGLIKGITTFDGSKGARLATYAARCVENAILSPMPLNQTAGKGSSNYCPTRAMKYPATTCGEWVIFWQAHHLTVSAKLPVRW